MKRLLSNIILVVAVLAGAASQAGAFQYTITDLGVYSEYEGWWKNSLAINNEGQIAGNSPSGAFIWEKGQKTYIGEGTHFDDINDSGYAVGWDEAEWRGFLWKDGIKYSIPMSESFGINNYGDVVGFNYFENNPNPYPTATILTDGVLTDLGSLWASRYSYGLAINDYGKVAGIATASETEHHAFFWENGVMTDIGIFGGNSFAGGINNSDQVVGGAYTLSGNFHAFLWEDGIMKDIGTLGNDSEASGINNNGQVVGSSGIASGATHAFLWNNNTGMADLNSMIDSKEWELVVANDINDKGQIVGYGNYNGERHSFLLSQGEAPPPDPPAGTPEPATLLLVGLGLIGLMKFRKKSAL